MYTYDTKHLLIPCFVDLGTIPDPWSQFLKKKTPEKDTLGLDPDYEGGGQTPLREVGTFPGELHEGTELDHEQIGIDVDSAMEVTESTGICIVKKRVDPNYSVPQQCLHTLCNVAVKPAYYLETY